MTIYLAMALSIFLTGFVKHNREIYLFMWVAMFLIIAGFRASTVGYDTLQFYTNYTWIVLLDFTESSLTRYEYGYFLFNKVLGLITHNPQFLVFVSSFIVNLTVFIFLKRYSKNYQISLLVYLLFGIFGIYMNLLRQALASIVILLGLPFILQKRLFVSLIIIYLSSLFHNSSLVFLIPTLLFFIKEEWSSKKLVFLTTLVSVVFIPTSKMIFDLALYLVPQYASYGDSVFADAGFLASSINYIIIFILVFFGYIYVLNNNYKFSRLDHFILLMGLTDLIISAVGVQTYIIYRLSYYFRVFQLLWVPIVIKSAPKQKEKIIIGWLFFIIASLYFIIVHSFRPEWQSIVPYQFFWN